MPHRCYLPDWYPVTGTLTVEGDEAHHLSRVVRCKIGDAVEVLNGQGSIASGEIVQVERRGLSLNIKRVEQVAKPHKKLTLIQATPKGKRQDLVLQKAVELGVQQITFVQTTNVIARVKPGEKEDKLARWQQVLIGGLKQSGNPWLPSIELAFDWGVAIAEANAMQGVVFLADLSEGARPLREVLPKYRNENQFAVCIGPEGDFTEQETATAHDGGCIPVNLGSRVLRTETAALYVMSVFAYEFLD